MEVVTIEPNEDVKIYEPISPRVTFVDWWNVLAQTILMGICTPTARKIGLDELFKLSNNMFPHVEEKVVSMHTSESLELWNLYKEKYKRLEHHACTVKDFWCGKINQAIQEYKDKKKKKNSNVQALYANLYRYRGMVNQNKLHDVTLSDDLKHKMKNIVLDECAYEMRHIDMRHDCNLQILKSKLTNYQVPAVADTSDIDKKIENFSSNEFEEIFSQNVKNIDYHIAEKLATECHHWLPLLIPH